MSAHVKQVVLHPGVTGALKVGSTTGTPLAARAEGGIWPPTPDALEIADLCCLDVAVGRDKLYRTVQYMARFLSWYGARNGFSKEVIAQLNALKGTLALSRKRASLQLVICSTVS